MKSRNKNLGNKGCFTATHLTVTQNKINFDEMKK